MSSYSTIVATPTMVLNELHDFSCTFDTDQEKILPQVVPDPKKLHEE